MWRILFTLCLAFMTAAASPVGVTPSELSAAVASVNDWRALGIFLFAFIIIREASSGWTRRQERLGQLADRKELTDALDRLTARVSAIGDAQLIHHAKIEGVMDRVDRHLSGSR